MGIMNNIENPAVIDSLWYWNEKEVDKEEEDENTI